MSPFFTVNGQAVQLAQPVYREGGIVYFPRQLFTEWLPGRYPRRLRYRDGALQRLPGVGADSVAAGQDDGGEVAADEPTDELPPLVVIDAGHGGVDPGRTAPNHTIEKLIVLRVAERLGHVLEQRGYEVHLTRTADTLIDLMDRSRMANAWKGDRHRAIFLSIHANGVTDTRAAGFETYFLSDARTEDERRVAEMENASLEYEDQSASDLAPGQDLEFILSGLRNDYYVHASHQLAELIQGEFAKFHPGPDRGVKQAGFVVLIGAFMPAVLIETGFISNRGEARLLRSEDFRRKLARGIADAVDEFFAANKDLNARSARR
jgi:N-acetylmuramoyl-L-alanine amidase